MSPPLSGKERHGELDFLRLLVDTVPALVSYIDAEYRYRFVNQSYRRWFGQETAELAGRHVRDVLGGEAWERVRSPMARALAGETVSYQAVLPYRDGGARPVSVVYTPDLDTEGHCRGFVVLVNDVSEAKRVEQMLLDKERMLAASQRMAHVGGWELELGDLVDRNRNPLRWTDECYRVFGFEPRSVAVSNDLFFSLVSAADRDRIVAAVDEALHSGKPYEIEHAIRWPSGEERFVHQWAEVERDRAGRPLRMLGTAQDVTERVRAERQRRELEAQREGALRELEEAARLKDEFLAMLAHELRNPLAPMLNAVELMRLEAPDDAALAKQREVIARQVHHMRRLLDDLLDVARVSQGKIQLRREPMDVAAAVLNAVEVSRPLIAAKQQELHLSLSQEPCIVQGDATRLTQVFANLLNNAAKYTHVGGHLSVRITRKDGSAEVQVKDDGIGMTADTLDHAFGLFVQADRSLDRAQGGLGIGLTMVKSLVEMHSGQVSARSEGLGHGSEVTVRLPLSGVRVEAPAEPRHAPAAPGRTLDILVVDDNRDAAETLVTLIELLGHRATQVHEGAAAVEVALARCPQIVLLDIGLPGMDGLEVARRLRAAGCTSTLVALTGYGREDDVLRSKQAGFDRHLTKPVDVATIREVVAERLWADSSLSRAKEAQGPVAPA